MKHVGHFSATGRQQLRHKYWQDSRCPRCGTRDEDSPHVVLCTAHEAVAHLADNIYWLEEELKKLGTHSCVTRTLIYTLFDQGNSSFAKNVPRRREKMPRKIYDAIKSAAVQQDAIAYQNIFDGHIVAEWGKAQELAYRQDQRQ